MITSEPPGCNVCFTHEAFRGLMRILIFGPKPLTHVYVLAFWLILCVLNIYFLPSVPSSPPEYFITQVGFLGKLADREQTHHNTEITQQTHYKAANKLVF